MSKPLLRCACPLDGIMSNCPFSYANGWHERRAAVLLQTHPSAMRKIAKMSKQALRAKADDNEYVFEENR